MIDHDKGHFIHNEQSFQDLIKQRPIPTMTEAQRQRCLRMSGYAVQRLIERLEKERKSV